MPLLNEQFYPTPPEVVDMMVEPYIFKEDSTEFRTFLDRQNAYIEQLPDKSFRSSGTDVATRLVVLRNGY